MTSIIAELKERGILVPAPAPAPAPALVERFALAGRAQARRHAHRELGREAKVTQARELLRVGEARRTAVLAAFVIERQAALTDLAIEMFDKLIGAAHRHAETVRKTRQLERADAMETFARNHLALCQALIAAREDGRPLAGAIERTLGWNGGTADADGIARALGRGEGNGLDELIGRRLALRSAARVILDVFELRSFKVNDPILQAVGLLRSLYAGERSSLPAKVPAIWACRKL